MRFLERAEQYTLEIINGRKKNGWDKIYRIFLFMLSHLYRLAVLARLYLYDHAILHRQNLGSFVVSVGNLTTGGTGKTPVVELLARTLAARGRNVAILSRGYRSATKKKSWKEKLAKFPRFLHAIWEKLLQLKEKSAEFFRFRKEQDTGTSESGKSANAPLLDEPDNKGKNEQKTPKIVSDGKEVLLDSYTAGDEPFMLARNLLPTNAGQRGVVVIVDKNRVYSGKYAIRNYKVDTLLLDDGFQYMPLRPRINIVLVDSTKPFHNHEMLPIGLMREPIVHIKKADYIFLTKCRKGKSYERLRRFLQRHNSSAPIIECNHEPCFLSNIDGTGHIPLEMLSGKKIAAICGIAVPRSFESYLENLGASIVYREQYVDHHRYTDEEIQNFQKKALENGADFCVTTEKDAVRIQTPSSPLLPFYFLRVEIVILAGKEHFDKCITDICMR